MGVFECGGSGSQGSPLNELAAEYRSPDKERRTWFSKYTLQKAFWKPDKGDVWAFPPRSNFLEVDTYCGVSGQWWLPVLDLQAHACARWCVCPHRCVSRHALLAFALHVDPHCFFSCLSFGQSWMAWYCYLPLSLALPKTRSHWVSFIRELTTCSCESGRGRGEFIEQKIKEGKS